MQMEYLKDYIKQNIYDGKLYFEKEEAISHLNVTQEQFRHQAYRLIKKNRIQHLTRNFFMIIPEEFQNMGVLPIQWIINPLMKHLNQNYYIGLLTAASMYGASHHQPMAHQIMTTKSWRHIKYGKGLIEFHRFKDIEHSRVEQISSPAGYSNISSKEQTVLDLVKFYPVCGFLSHVAGVVSDLANSCQEMAFSEAIKNEKNNTILQRLGFILEKTKHENLSKIIEDEMKNRSFRFILLRPDVESKEGMRSDKFKIIENETLEVEE